MKLELPDGRWFIPAVILFTLLWAAACMADIDFDRWADAIYKAEGGRTASVPYGIMFDGCDWEHEDFCRKICKNTIRNTLIKHRESRCAQGEDDVSCLARRYAPIGADNDPNGLNRNWEKNVRKLLNSERNNP